MKKESYKQIAICAMRNADGNGLLLDIPLYIKVGEINAGRITAIEDELIGRVSAEMMKRYDSEIARHIANLKQGGQANAC